MSLTVRRKDLKVDTLLTVSSLIQSQLSKRQEPPKSVTKDTSHQQVQLTFRRAEIQTRTSVNPETKWWAAAAPLTLQPIVRQDRTTYPQRSKATAAQPTTIQAELKLQTRLPVDPKINTSVSTLQRPTLPETEMQTLNLTISHRDLAQVFQASTPMT